MGRRLTPSTGDGTTTIRTIETGGTNASNPIDALVNLNGISIDLLDSPNGVAILDEDGFVLDRYLTSQTASVPNIDGKINIRVNQIVEYQITNFDYVVDYVLSCDTGSVVRVHDVIVFTAPSVSGVTKFTVNGKEIIVNVWDDGVITPSVITPVNNAINVNNELTILSSSFNTTGLNDTHVSSDWQIATDANFSSVVFESLNDTVNKTTWSVSGLVANTDYFVSVRYNAAVLANSDWSPTVKFKTKSNFIGVNEQAKLVAADGITLDYFGYSVAISDDGNTAVIGAYCADPVYSAQGAVYVYRRNNGVWSQQIKLFPIDGIATDHFGWSVTISADSNTIAVGSRDADPKGSASGAVYIYVFRNSVWNYEIKLFPTDGAAAQYFGCSVSLSADGNRLLVGANGANPKATNSGAAYVYLRSDTTWALEVKIFPADGISTDYFGYSVSLSADGATAAISAYWANVRATDSGAVYIFIRSDTSWTQQAKLSASDGAASDYFGNSVSLSSSGDYLVVGAYSADPKGSSSGAAYVFSRTDTTWTQQTKFIPSDGVAGDNFGWSVAISGDGTTILIGSYKSDPASKANAGSVYVYNRLIDTWTFFKKQTASDSTAGDLFGTAVASSHNGSTWLVGSSYASPKGLNSGAAYIYA